jgi:hypothetical protein
MIITEDVVLDTLTNSLRRWEHTAERCRRDISEAQEKIRMETESLGRADAAVAELKAAIEARG